MAHIVQAGPHSKDIREERLLQPEPLQATEPYALLHAVLSCCLLQETRTASQAGITVERRFLNLIETCTLFSRRCSSLPCCKNTAYGCIDTGPPLYGHFLLRPPVTAASPCCHSAKQQRNQASKFSSAHAK